MAGRQFEKGNPSPAKAASKMQPYGTTEFVPFKTNSNCTGTPGSL